jgi:16S rRNA G966 N2-methylase RsmD
MLPILQNKGSVYVDTTYQYKGLIEDFLYIQQDIKPRSTFITDVSYTYKKPNNYIENVSSNLIYHDTQQIDNPLTSPLEVNVSPDFSKRMFGDNLKYRFSDVSLFSTTPHDQSAYTVELISQFVDKNTKSILDSSACIGGNTIQFSSFFKDIYAVELYSKHVELLKHNLSLKNINNVNVIKDNILNVDINTDIIFYDPPWENFENEDYYYQLGGTKVFLKSLIEKNRDKEMIVIKVENKYNEIFRIQKKTYTYYINDNNNIPIYKLIILTNNTIKNKIKEKSFLRLRYKEEQKIELNYREFANIVKNKLISKYVDENSKIADIGSGKGGDLIKYLYSKMSFAYLIEPNPNNFIQLKQRFSNITQQNKFKLIQASGQNMPNIEKVDRVFMFFSLNFFSFEDLKLLIKNIINITKERAKVIFTYMDGQRTKDILSKNNGIWEQYNYKIEDKGGNKVKIYIDAETVTMEGQDENLVYHDFLANFMKEGGFKLIDNNTFDNEYEYYKLVDEHDKIFTSLYRYDVFEKL